MSTREQFETAVAALSLAELAGIVQLAALTEESYDPAHEDENGAYETAMGEHPDPEMTRHLLTRLTNDLPR